MLSLRSIDFKKDMPFLRAVYASTREAEMQMFDLSETEKQNFIDMQFNAQYRQYQGQFSDASFNIIVHDDVDIGRLYVDRRDDEIRIIDIALLAVYRNHGFGSSLLKTIFTEADKANLPVRIHVEVNNPALKLYEKLGFVTIDNQVVNYYMERLPDRNE